MLEANPDLEPKKVIYNDFGGRILIMKQDLNRLSVYVYSQWMIETFLFYGAQGYIYCKDKQKTKRLLSWRLDGFISNKRRQFIGSLD